MDTLNNTIKLIHCTDIHQIKISASYWNMVTIAKGIKESLKDIPLCFRLIITDYCYDIEVVFLWLAWGCNETCNEKCESIYMHFNDKEETLWDDKTDSKAQATDYDHVQNQINKAVIDYLDEIKNSGTNLNGRGGNAKMLEEYLSGRMGEDINEIFNSITKTNQTY